MNWTDSFEDTFTQSASSSSSEFWSRIAGLAAVNLLLIYLTRTKSKGVQHDPPYLWQYLPFIGCAIDMGQDIVGFVRKNCYRYGAPLFRATLVGNSCYFLGDADLVLMAYTHPSLDFSQMHKDFLSRVAGMKRCQLDSMFRNPKMLKGLRSIFAKHILGREALAVAVTDAQHTLSAFIDQKLGSDEWVEVDLMEFCFNAVVLASTGPFVSKEMAQEECVKLLKAFDAGVSLAVAGLPTYLLPNFSRARDEIIRRLKSTTTETPIVASLRLLSNEGGLDEDFIIREMLVLFWAVNANSAPAVFWALARLLLDDSAQEAVQAELDRQQKLGVKDLEDLEKLTVLRSVFWETLRLSWGGFTPRIVKEDIVMTTSGRKDDTERWRLRQGSRVMTYAPVVHRDERIFANPDDFVHDRFLPDENGKEPEFRTQRGKKIGISSFGGGAHLCPGRK